MSAAEARRATRRIEEAYKLSARAKANAAGVSPDIAEEMLRILIRSSLTTQEHASVVARGAGSGRRAGTDRLCGASRCRNQRLPLHPRFQLCTGVS